MDNTSESRSLHAEKITSFGMNVEVTFKSGVKYMYYNVTEIHYSHPPEHLSVAFESDIHSTGANHSIRFIKEFEAKTTDIKHEEFSKRL